MAFISYSAAVFVASQFSSVGFSGSRVPGFGSQVAGSVASLLPSSSSVSVGCAQGVDAAVRAACPSAQVFAVASGAWGSGRQAFARRSSAFVSALAASSGVLVSFPSGPCPVGVRASHTFRGCGSGTWGSLALALGLGVPVLAFVPCAGGVPWAALGPLASRFVIAPFGAGGSSLGCWVWAAAPIQAQGTLF